ncbi:MAG: two-component sensor histidine kinase [Geobacter sp.]|nr:MAG: two-component sensor histidine kinase [Geobacter sp.]
MFFKSIRFTLTLWYSVTLAVILILFSSFFYVSLRNQLYQEADRDLLAIAEAIASPTFEPFYRGVHSEMDQLLEDFIGDRIAGKYVRILDRRGNLRASTSNLDEIRLPTNKRSLAAAAASRIVYETHRDSDRYPVRIITFPVLVRGQLDTIIQVGSSLVGPTEILNKILLIFTISIPLSLLLLVYGGWFLAGRALKPVELITRSARRISAENLSHRLDVVNPRDEIGRLAETFNATLARLENSFNRTRRFSADVSHELRTPLTILRGEIEVGLKWAKEPDEFRELMKSNMEEVNRMSRIVESLLELSRAEENGLSLNLQEVELRELLQELIHQFSTLAAEKGVLLEFVVDRPARIRGDRTRLQQVFLNLLDNALKYTESGNTVRLSLENDEAYAKVSVSDRGQGIPTADLPYIFDRFYRVDEARNRADGGSGLGLSLVKSYTEAHGGRIDVVSEVGKGSTFTVFLPLIDSSAAGISAEVDNQ